MGPSEIPTAEAALPPVNKHAGSAAMQLTGGAVLSVLLASVVLHALGLTGMFFLAFSFAARREKPPPLTRVELVGDPAALPSVDFNKPVTADDFERFDPLDVRFTPTKFEPLSKITTIEKPDLSIIGIGAGGGDFSDYGLSVGDGAAPRFFGLGGSAQGANRIVYVVDRSGSMLDTFRHVQDELQRSISMLRRSQKFHVIFFNSGEPLEKPPPRLVSAIEAHKTAFFGFLQAVFPEGSTHPENAMHRALNLEPDLIYFLTDGEFDEGLLPKLDRWNQDRRVQIFTIAYFDESGAGQLEQIAREHGGDFRFVSENDLP